MKIIVCGVGKVGETLLETLVKEGHEVNIIDIYQKKVDNCSNKFDIKGVVGAGAEREVLLQSDIQNADFFIACTSRDEFNILVCILAKKLGAKKTICRVRDPRYFREIENLKSDLGIDMMFNPEYRTALEIAKILRFPSAISIESFASGKATMCEFEVDGKDPIIDKTVMDIIKETEAKIIFGVIVRGEQVFIPQGDFIIKEGDRIHIIGSDAEITAFSKKLKIYKPRAKSVFIIGGGKVAFYLAEVLTRSGVSVKILEKDNARCEELSEKLPQSTILFGDGSETEVLDEEDIKNADACVTLTGIDEENVIISLYALTNNVNKVITKINSSAINDMASKLGLDTVVSPRNVIANHVIRYVRANSEEETASLKRLYMIEDGVDAIDFVCKESFKKIGISLKDMKIKKNNIIGAIVRNGEYVFPTGDTTIEIGDRVVIVTKKSLVTDLNDIFN